MVQGADESLSQDSFDDGNQFDEQEGEEGEGDEWEGVELARLATIREEEERWGFTQTRELTPAGKTGSPADSSSPARLWASSSYLSQG